MMAFLFLEEENDVQLLLNRKLVFASTKVSSTYPTPKKIFFESFQNPSFDFFYEV